jgi:hypothetical protein
MRARVDAQDLVGGREPWRNPLEARLAGRDRLVHRVEARRALGVALRTAVLAVSRVLGNDGCPTSAHRRAW